MYMASNEMTVEGKELLSSLRIKIRWPRTFGVRMRVTAALLWLAGCISPIAIDAKVVEADGDADFSPRKGGINRGHSKVTTRPDPPGPTRSG